MRYDKYYIGQSGRTSFECIFWQQMSQCQYMHKRGNHIVYLSIFIEPHMISVEINVQCVYSILSYSYFHCTITMTSLFRRKNIHCSTVKQKNPNGIRQQFLWPTKEQWVHLLAMGIPVIMRGSPQINSLFHFRNLVISLETSLTSQIYLMYVFSQVELLSCLLFLK